MSLFNRATKGAGGADAVQAQDAAACASRPCALSQPTCAAGLEAERVWRDTRHERAGTLPLNELQQVEGGLKGCAHSRAGAGAA